MNKFDRFQVNIKNNYDDKVVINLSPSTSFRSRCEFSYGKNHYVMHDVNGNRQFYVKPSAIKRDRRAKGRLRAQIRSKKAEL